jgi:hypothetical protein
LSEQLPAVRDQCENVLVRALPAGAQFGPQPKRRERDRCVGEVEQNEERDVARAVVSV